MHLRVFIILFFFIPFMAVAQPSDFIVLKKKGKTRHTYYAGTRIEFVSTSGAYRDALINYVQGDTLYLQEFLIRYIPTTLGTYITDTTGSFRYKYHYNQIASLGPQRKKGFNMQGSGASLFGGGTLLMLGSGVVYLADRKNYSPVLFGASAGLAALGYMMMKSGSKGIIPGKHGYKLNYIDMTP